MPIFMVAYNNALYTEIEYIVNPRVHLRYLDNFLCVQIRKNMYVDSVSNPF